MDGTVTGIIYDWLWVDLDKNITGRTEYDCGVSDNNTICDLFWNNLATEIATWVGKWILHHYGCLCVHVDPRSR